MKKQLVIVGITILLFAVGLSGCTDNVDNTNDVDKTDKDIIIGSWETNDIHYDKYTFTKDGKLYGYVDPQDADVIKTEYTIRESNYILTIYKNWTGEYEWMGELVTIYNYEFVGENTLIMKTERQVRTFTRVVNKQKLKFPSELRMDLVSGD